VVKLASRTRSRAEARRRARRARCGLLVLLAFLPPAPALAQPASVQAILGWQGWTRYGTWNPLTVEVHTEREVSGWLVVELPQEFGRQRVRLRYPVELPPGGRSTRTVPVWLSDVRRPVKVFLLARDGTGLASQEVVPQPEAAVAGVVGYLGAEPPTPPAQGPGAGRRVVVRLREELLPEHAAAYASLELLVVGELDERRLHEAQRQALQTWVLHGGRVVVTGPLHGGPLSSWLSVARELGAGAQAVGLRSVAGPLRELEPAGEGQPVVERSRTVAVGSARGLGWVYVWAAGPHQVPPDSPLWWLALPASSPREVPPEPDSRPRLPLAPAAVGLGAYAALWVLAVAVAGRRPWGWWGVAAVVVASAAGMPALADQVRQRAAPLEVREVHVEVEGSARLYGWGYGRAPYAGSYTYSLPRAEAVSASGGFSEAEVTFLPEHTVVRVRQAAGERVSLYWEAEAPPQGSAVVEVGQGTVSVRGAEGLRGMVFWGRRQAPLEQSGPGLWVASRWSAMEPEHPALLAFRWTHPEAASIVEDRPLVTLSRGDGQGWRVVVGKSR